MDYIELVQYSFFSMVFPAFFCFYIVSKNRGFYFLFIFLSGCIFNSIFNVVSHIVALYFENSFVVQILIRILLLSLIAWMARIVREMFLLASKEQKEGWGVFCLFPILLIICQFTLQMRSSNKIDIEHKIKIPYLYLIYPDEIPSILCIFFCIIIVYVFISFSFRFYQQLKEAKMNEQVFDLQTKALEKQCLEYATKEPELKIIQHDMKHHLRLIMALIQERKNKEATEYIMDKCNILGEVCIKNYCEDVILNAVLSLYLEQAKSAEIECNVKLELIEKLPVQGKDFAVMVANLFENAICAVNKLEKEKRKIDIWLQVKDNKLTLQVINPYCGEILIGEDGRPYSLEKGHGFGTQSIAAI